MRLPSSATRVRQPVSLIYTYRRPGNPKTYVSLVVSGGRVNTCFEWKVDGKPLSTGSYIGETFPNAENDLLTQGFLPSSKRPF